jgi:predicted DNA-binding WGR domain protein
MVRTFKRQEGPRARRWEAEVDGSDVVYRTGVDGGRMRTRRVGYATIADAAQAVNDAAETMRQAGWEEEVAVVETATTDPVPSERVVLADRLTEAGDPRGELILVQRALADRPDDPRLLEAEQRLLRTHGPRWLGSPHPDVRFVWQDGYIDAVELPTTVDAAGELSGLVATGSLGALRSLRVRSDRVEGVVEVLVRNPWPHLRTLALAGDDDVRAPLGPLLQRMPVLRDLTLRARTWGFDAQRPAGLERLEVDVELLDAERLALLDLPSLADLTVSTRRLVPIDRAALQRVTARPLRRLVLGGGTGVDWLAGLVQPPRLRTLVLRAPLQPRELGYVLEQQRGLLGDVRIRLEGFELGDATLARLQGLDLVVPLPDAAPPRRADQRSTRQDRWRRFEKEGKRGGRFWSIVRDGATVVVRHGARGHEGREQRTSKRTDVAAAAEYERRVRRKVTAGWVEVSDP